MTEFFGSWSGKHNDEEEIESVETVETVTTTRTTTRRKAHTPEVSSYEAEALWLQIPSYMPLIVTYAGVFLPQPFICIAFSIPTIIFSLPDFDLWESCPHHVRALGVKRSNLGIAMIVKVFILDRCHGRCQSSLDTNQSRQGEGDTWMSATSTL